MTVTIAANRLESHGASRKAGFCDEVRRWAVVDGENLIVSAEDWHALTWLFAPRAPQWLAKPLVSPEARESRRAACGPCDWHRDGPTGGERCENPCRSCARFHPQLSEETCPLGKWPLG